MRRAAVLAIGAALSCRGILGIGDPLPFDPDAGSILNPAGETPAVTEDAAACGFANLVTDPKNCGRCEHSCQGGPCERGRCQPTMTTTSDTEVFAVKEGKVYAVDKSQLVRVAPNGERTVVASAVTAPRAMLASTVHVLWSDDNGVHLCSVTGCSADGPLQMSASGKRTGPLAELPDEAALYPYIWANYSDSTVEKATSTPGATTVLSTSTQVANSACAPSFAEAKTSAYLYDNAGKHFLVYAAEDAGGRNAGAEPAPCALAASETNVFYTDSASVQRAAVNPDGTLAPAVPFATGLTAPRVLAADDTFVYWAASTAVTDIVRCPVTGCDKPTVVVEAIPAVTALAVEGDFVYFAIRLNNALGTMIYRVAQ